MPWSLLLLFEGHQRSRTAAVPGPDREGLQDPYHPWRSRPRTHALDRALARRTVMTVGQEASLEGRRDRSSAVNFRSPSGVHGGLQDAPAAHRGPVSFPDPPGTTLPGTSAQMRPSTPGRGREASRGERSVGEIGPFGGPAVAQAPRAHEKFRCSSEVW